jgi:hypothetical protein
VKERKAAWQGGRIKKCQRRSFFVYFEIASNIAIKFPWHEI